MLNNEIRNVKITFCKLVHERTQLIDPNATLGTYPFPHDFSCVGCPVYYYLGIGKLDYIGKLVCNVLRGIPEKQKGRH